MWHVSISAQRRRRWIEDEGRLERLAVAALEGVGSDELEWWIAGLRLNPNGAYVGHLRVPVTPAELVLVPPGIVTTDAGETGPPRPRTRRHDHAAG